MSNDRVQRLQTYAEGLRTKLKSAVPKRHDTSDASRAGYKQMLEIDLKKTEATIAKLRGL